MKKLLFVLYIAIGNAALGQITLKECVQQGLINRPNLKTAKTESLVAALKSVETQAKYLPQISLAYDYRYNAIIPAQIVPVGQFSPVATDEKRAIKFGAPWQQNAGVTIYQPVIDAALKSRLKESKLNESLAAIDTKKAAEELTFEIVKTYSRILNFEYDVKEAIADTSRSQYSYAIVASKFIEGQILKTELNTALINHKNNIVNYKKAVASLTTEKIYLHYLTNIKLERLLDETFTGIPGSLLDQGNSIALQADSIAAFQSLLAKEKLVAQQIITERKKNIPTIGLQGFLGASQFSSTFNPVLKDSWFGNSYVGVTMKLPILSTEKSINADKQLKAQFSILANQKEELINKRNQEMLQVNVEIDRLKEEVTIRQENLALLKENIKVYQLRVQEGKYAAGDLNVQEAELQKLSVQISQLKEQLNKALVERLYVSGGLSEKINQ